ncbi:hypothetical protein DL93DRAFT_575753 [Clavulina sp. PMI_390]|nr:hypothetical protein DL93DRAFT_575753 [Clavulina sp. PMI_390]
MKKTRKNALEQLIDALLQLRLPAHNADADPTAALVRGQKLMAVWREIGWVKLDELAGASCTRSRQSRGCGPWARGVVVGKKKMHSDAATPEALCALLWCWRMSQWAGMQWGHYALIRGNRHVASARRRCGCQKKQAQQCGNARWHCARRCGGGGDGGGLHRCGRRGGGGITPVRGRRRVVVVGRCRGRSARDKAMPSRKIAS